MLGQTGAAIEEQADARKQRMDADAAWKLISSAAEVRVVKGKQLKIWHPASDGRAEILADVMGPSGNLRAPTLKMGDTVLVGFHEQSTRDLLG